MKNKILVLVGVLVILVAVAMVPSLMDKFGQSSKKIELSLFEPGTNLTDYAQITVKEEKNSVVLSRNNDIWHVDQVYPADVDHINAFLAEVPKIIPTEIAAANSASHSRLGLDDENATIVTFDKSVSGNKPLTIYIGNFVRIQDNFFVRRGDQDMAYLATNHLMKELASYRRTEWQNKEVMNVGEKEVTKLSWSGDKKSGSLAKLDDENWQAVINGKSFKVKTDRVQPILAAMNPL
ncbi:DUF4340 domain-containing protein, partial [Candidatus Uhrbacteria bacterium]|nr:DUF4340 domain-containing protein [Candidatus Uhrbacteria bacterium]